MGFRTGRVSDRNGFWTDTSFRMGWVSDRNGFLTETSFRTGRVSGCGHLNKRLGFSTLIYHRAISIDQDNRFNQAGYRGGAIRLCHTANSTPYHGSAKLLAETFYLFIQFKSQDFAMTLDKSWTKITNKVDPVFINGAIAFAERGKTYVDSEGRIHCPCKKCVNARRHVPTVVADHIIYNGFEPSYNVWIHHGEHLPGYEIDDTDSDYEESENESHDGVNELFDDVFPTGGETEAENFMDGANLRNNPNVEKLFVDMEKPLYPGCDEFSVLGFLLELMNVKVTCKMTNVSMDMILNLFSRALKDANLPKNHYEAKKYLRTLGLGYESIHACKHDCALFWKENAELQNCPVCGTSRYKENSKGKKKPTHC
uniref:Putative transposase-associated domain-containing protein n=1 Tax=Helianthus annuus TaxID=4232 RepID=A0A251RXL6_HELAN